MPFGLYFAYCHRPVHGPQVPGLHDLEPREPGSFLCLINLPVLALLLTDILPLVEILGVTDWVPAISTLLFLFGILLFLLVFRQSLNAFSLFNPFFSHFRFLRKHPPGLRLTLEWHYSNAERREFTKVVAFAIDSEMVVESVSTALA